MKNSHTDMLIFLAVAAVLCAGNALATSINANCGEDILIRVPACSGSGPGTVTPPALVCAPPSVPNPAGTACVTPTPPSNLSSAACGVTGQVYTQTMPWPTPSRLYQTMGADDAIVIQFTTGSTSSSGSLPRIAAGEYGSPPSPRLATLSPKQCDFGPQPTVGAAGEGNSVTMVFALGTGSGFGYYPVLALNTTYYLNVKNSPSSTCRTNGSCDMFVDLVKPGGLMLAHAVNHELAALKEHATKTVAACSTKPKEAQAGCYTRANGQIDAILKAAQ